ncbi:metallophosphoesterase [Mycobacterium sp. Y57]|uniref:metallophosphoesterase family protein n=1 Tax=Mycolicibacterium xanthum TaxID=2796469 RepID=UPI001C85AEBB|nr:metallophosphoesterase [Mycolicibacterium xanthum]MBX7432542.1 metallophosphoesterase [Mycolicibacterium xanthum]
MREVVGYRGPQGGQSLRIIHLSDVHFGKEHIFGGEKTPAGDFVSGGPSLAESIRADLAQIEDAAPQIVCLTGDLTQTASPAEFEQARLFCEALCYDNASLGPLAIVPGNHDVDWTAKSGKTRMRPWSHFLVDLRGTADDWTDDRRDAYVRTDLVKSHGVLIAEINSCRFVEKDTPDEQRGRVSEKALDELETQLSKLKRGAAKHCIRIALVHHHPILIPELAEQGRGYDSIHGAGHLLRILRQHGFHLLLHGHKHNPFTFTEDSLRAQQEERHAHPLFVVCGGSASSSALPAESPINCYNRIDIKWLPDAQQYRCRVETRTLIRARRGMPLIRTRWSWQALSRDDRSFRPERFAAKNDRLSWREFNARDKDTRRKQQYRRSRGVFPTVAVRPSLTPGQAHEALVELRSHPCEDVETIDVERVRWSAGPKHAVFELGQEHSRSRFRAVFSYYGPMLIQASVTWVDGHKADLFIYAQSEEIEQ